MKNNVLEQNIQLKNIENNQSYYIYSIFLLILLSESLILQTNGIIAKIAFVEFFKAVGGSSWEEIMKKNEKSHEVITTILYLIVQRLIYKTHQLYQKNNQT